MQKSSSDMAFPQMQRVRQYNNYYCGPAALMMLLNFLGKEIRQEDVVMAAGVAHKVKTHGMLIEELGRASNVLAPGMVFWLKRNSSMRELSEIVNEHKHPVGVEWQGVFQYDSDEEEADDDPGHYSVVTAINTRDNFVLLSDPYEDYAGRDRRFSILEFERRWWDINEVTDPETGEGHEMDDYHAIFLVAAEGETFPEKYFMERYG